MGLISEMFSCCLLRTIDSYSKARPCVQDNTQWHMLDMAAFGDSQTPPPPPKKKTLNKTSLNAPWPGSPRTPQHPHLSPFREQLASSGVPPPHTEPSS